MNDYLLVAEASNGLADEPIVTNLGGWFSYVVLPRTITREVHRMMDGQFIGVVEHV